jgi:hypothetical protein
MPILRILTNNLSGASRDRLARRSKRAVFILAMVLFALGSWAIYARFRVHVTRAAFEEAYDRRMALFQQRKAWESDRLALRDILYRKTFDEDASKGDSAFRDFRERNDSQLKHVGYEEVQYHGDVLALVGCTSTEPVGSTTFGAICRRNIDLNPPYFTKFRQKLAVAAQSALGDPALSQEVQRTTNLDDLIRLAIVVDQRIKARNENLLKTLGGDPRWAVYLESYSRWRVYSEAYLEYALENKIRLLEEEENLAWRRYYEALRSAYSTPFSGQL